MRDARDAADGPKVRPALVRVERIRVMLGIALLVSLGLWILILQAIRLFF